MKNIAEIIFKSIPLISIAVLMYVLFRSPDSELSEGVKLSLSALLGAIISYFIIQFSKYIDSIESRKSNHRRALASLEYKLNDTLNWLSDVKFNMGKHMSVVSSVIDGQALIANDASSYRDSPCTEEHVLDLLNTRFANQMFFLLAGLKKLENDLVSLHGSYKYMVNLAVSDEKYYSSYKSGLPRHLEDSRFIFNYTDTYIEKTKDAICTCRVLAKDSMTFLGSIRRYFTLHHDPENFKALEAAEKKQLLVEIQLTGSESGAEINGIIGKSTMK